MAFTAQRSFLFVPGDRPERFEKAWAAGADMVIIDLEDAVSAARKALAREAAAQWLSPARPVALRINAHDTEWFEDDLMLCSDPGVAAVMLPKAEQAEPVQRLHEAAPAAAIWPLVESAAGIAALASLAGLPGVQRLAFGSIDFQLDTGIEDEELLVFRSQIVLASRVAGLMAPIDGVTTRFDDLAAVRDDARRARRLGFAGKLCIHPRQVAVVHEVFAPSADELAWAGRVMQAARQADGAAVALDGNMIDKPVIARARAVLAAAKP
jgi:citrate lyase subunit beta/citryl-CoA lyase